MKQIFCRIDKCLGCKSCELACAVAHSQSKTLTGALQESPMPVHRVKVSNLKRSQQDIQVRAMAIQCRHCEEPACLDACICGGITKDPETGDVKYFSDKCVACWSCIMACPFGAVLRAREQGCAVKCDRCPDRDTPACVHACPTGALVWCEAEDLKGAVVYE